MASARDARGIRQTALAPPPPPIGVNALLGSGTGGVSDRDTPTGSALPDIKPPSPIPGTGAIGPPPATINSLGGVTRTSGDQQLVGVDPTGLAAANAYQDAGLSDKMPASLPGSPNAASGGSPATQTTPKSQWDQDAAALWKSIGEGFDAQLKSQQGAIAAQTSGLQRRNIEMGALRGNSGLGGAAQAGTNQAVLTGAQMQSDAVAGVEKQKLGAKMAMLQMYMDRAKAEDNLEAQKQIQQMMSETSIAMALAQGGGLDWTQYQKYFPEG